MTTTLEEKPNFKRWSEDSCCPFCGDHGDYGFSFDFDENWQHQEVHRTISCPECQNEWTERYNLSKIYSEGKEEIFTSEEEDLLAYENKRMRAFLEKLGFSPSEITDLVINGGEFEEYVAFRKVKEPTAIKLRGSDAQRVLDLFFSGEEGSLWHSESSCTHDPDLQCIFLEIAPSYKNEKEFQDGYKKLEEILQVSNLDYLVRIDY
ncbi:hypothetical protein [Aliarcobacter skirrowii]|uniref:hypothetical protein n=1 Tax=Aliarcobacter skirrowii TaxID=28200 RepID=UPI0029A9C508|nr:hypothetical protein [Aliarcobacter skirrowii]MDX4028338.1 hypothetical protein [Aliarcobacter skirrowii]